MSEHCEDPGVEELVLFAWVGRDELAPKGEDGDVGLKAGMTPAGYIPLVAVKKEKVAWMEQMLQQQANVYGKTIRLCKFKFDGELVALRPK